MTGRRLLGVLQRLELDQIRGGTSGSPVLCSAPAGHGDIEVLAQDVSHSCLATTEERGEEVTEIRAGHIVHMPGGEWQWHSAAPDDFMTHVSISESVPDEARPEGACGEHVTDDEYFAIANADPSCR
jgi:hypothetical protein